MRLLVVLLALLAGPAMAQSVTVKGPDGHTVTLTSAELRRLAPVAFTFDAHGEKHLYSGPLLIDVLALVGTPTGKALRGPALATIVVVSAADGYKVAFGLGELDPGTRPNRVILAASADGLPLDAKNGPFKIVVEGDLRPARAVRMVQAIEVVNLDGAGGGAQHDH